MIEEQALAALGELDQVVLIDLLVFSGQRRLLTLAEGLARIVAQLLARQPRGDDAPFAPPTRIGLVLGAGAVRSRHEDGGQCEHLEHPSVSHHGSPINKYWTGF